MAKGNETVGEVRIRGRKRVSQERQKLVVLMRRTSSMLETDLNKNIGRYGEIAVEVGREIGVAEAREEARNVHAQNRLLRWVVALSAAGALTAWFFR